MSGRIVANDALGNVAEPTNTPGGSRQPKGSRAGNGDALDIVAWLSRHGIEARNPRTRGGLELLDIRCPVAPEHGFEAWVGQDASGKLSAACYHATCSLKSWRDLRAMFEPLHAREARPPDAHGEPQPSPVVACGLEEVVGVARRWMYLPDPRGLYAALGAYAANAQEGDPVWLLVVGASGTGKTEAVATLTGLEGVHAVSTLTEASLLSGSSKKDKAKDAKGGLLREVGERGVLLVKDFTSILSMHRDARAAVLAALREIYDGSYTRRVGTDGGKSLAWSGRIGLIGCTTPIIDTHHAVMASMGERFLFYRMPEVDRHALTRSALGHARNGAAMRREIAEAVRGLLAGINPEASPVALSPERMEHLIALANYTAIARSAVERDGRSREIELVVGAEAPTRLAIGLSRLLGGMQTIGVDDLTAWRTTVKVALDCIPALRRAILDTLSERPGLSTSEAAESIAYPTTTTRRTLEDLHAYGLVDRELRGAGNADRWTLSRLAYDLRASVPEMSVGVLSESTEGTSI